MPTLLKNPASWGPSLASTMQAALFLDRDGVINVDRAVRTHGYRLVVVPIKLALAAVATAKSNSTRLSTGCAFASGRNGHPSTACIFPPTIQLTGWASTSRTCIPQAEAWNALPGPARARDRPGSFDDKLSDVEAGIAAGVGRNLLLQAEDGGASPHAGYVRIEALREVLSFLADPGSWRS